MSKKIVCLILAMIMALSLCACSGSTTGSAPEKKPAASEPASSSAAPSGDTAVEENEALSAFTDVAEGVTVESLPWIRGDILAYSVPGDGFAKKTPDDTIVFGTNSTIKGCDPAGDMQEFIWNFNVYESLMQYNTSTGELEPCLATAWEYDADGNLHITLREGVKFHDGNTMTAEDVMFTLQRCAGINRCKASEACKKIDFDKSVIEDDTHIVLVMKEAYGSLISFLASNFCGIMSKDFVEKAGADYSYMDADCGTGPYYLVESVTGASQTFKAFGDYWGEAPDVGNIVFRRYEDYISMFIDYENGDLDVCFRNNFDSTTRVISGESPNTTVYRVPNNRSIYVTYPTIGDEAVFSDKRVRQAFAECIDFENLIYGVYEDPVMASTATSVFMKGVQYSTDVGTYEYNPEHAAELMKEAGYSTSKPCEVKILVTSGGGTNDLCAEMLQSYMGEVGFTVTIDTVKTAVLQEALNSLDYPTEYDMFINTGDIGNGAPASLIAGKDAFGKEIGKFAPAKAIDDEKFHELVAAAEATTDEAERTELYAQLQQEVYDNVWFMTLLPNASMVFCHDYVQNTEFLNGYSARWSSWTLAK